MLILVKDDDGAVEALELSDLDEPRRVRRRVQAELAELLAEDDVEHLAAAMDPGSVAGVLIYENLWAAPFASAMRRSGVSSSRFIHPVSVTGVAQSGMTSSRPQW